MGFWGQLGKAINTVAAASLEQQYRKKPRYNELLKCGNSELRNICEYSNSYDEIKMAEFILKKRGKW